MRQWEQLARKLPPGLPNLPRAQAWDPSLALSPPRHLGPGGPKRSTGTAHTPHHGADLGGSSEPPCLACQTVHVAVRRRRRGRLGPWGAPCTHASFPHTRGLTRDVKASTRPPPPAPSLLPNSPLPSREGWQPQPLLPLQPPVPAARQSLRPSALSVGTLAATSPLVCFLNCACLSARGLSGFCWVRLNVHVCQSICRSSPVFSH